MLVVRLMNRGETAEAERFYRMAVGSGYSDSLINLGITAVVPPVLLFPWTIRVVTQPALLLLEAGIQAPGLARPGPRAMDQSRI